MKAKGFYSKLAINAMYRASKIAEKIASEHDLKMPLWQDGKIVYIESQNSKRELCSNGCSNKNINSKNIPSV